jgi:hypothetical protein
LAAKSFSRIWAPYSVLSYSNNLTPRLVMAVGASWLGELNDQISLEKNVLIQLTAGEMAEPRTRREFLNSGTRRGGSDHLPQHFGRHASSPDPACFVVRPRERAFGDATGLLPFIDRNLHPWWDWNSTDVPSLAQGVGDDRMLLARLDRVNPKRKQLAAAQSAPDQHRDHGMIPLAPQRTPDPRLRATASPVQPSASFQRELRSGVRPLTRLIPAASSGLSRPESAASNATRRTAAKRRLMVVAAYCFCSTKIRHLRTPVRLNARRGSEQYQSTKSVTARS